MKQPVLLVTLIFIAIASSFAQTEIWKQQNYCIGANAGGFPGGLAGTIPTMAEVIQLPGGNYRMYFNSQYNFGQRHCVSYAESTDGITWSSIDTAFCGSSDTTQRNFIIGGPSVIELPNGQFRMYYRCTQKYPNGGTPQYHVRSAISNDGLSWSQEGIRIDIKPFQPGSPFYLVGHGSYFLLADSTFAGIFSANPDSTTLQSASSLIHATSADGLTWGNYSYLYYQHHDPIVVKQFNTYILYAMDLAKKMVKAVSNTGTTWPATTDSVSFLDTSNVPMLINNTKRIGDVGGLALPNGDIYLYTNYSGTSTTGPSLDIIRFTLSNQTGIVNTLKEFEKISVAPNPSVNMITVNSARELGFINIYTPIGEAVFQRDSKNTLEQIDISSLPAGLYILQAADGFARFIKE